MLKKTALQILHSLGVSLMDSPSVIVAGNSQLPIVGFIPNR